MRLRLLTPCCALMLVLGVSACGFQLQGQAGLPPVMDTTRLEIQDPYSPFARRLLTLLEQNGVHVVTSGEAGAVLEVPVNEVRRDVLTIGDNARVREYRVWQRVEFRLVDADGSVLLPTQRLQQSRVISFDETDILASTREEEFLRQDLADVMSRTVLRRLSQAGD